MKSAGLDLRGGVGASTESQTRAQVSRAPQMQFQDGSKRIIPNTLGSLQSKSCSSNLKHIEGAHPVQTAHEGLEGFGVHGFYSWARRTELWDRPVRDWSGLDCCSSLQGRG